jgi:DNA-binding GntR family transcriptional regulator
MGLSTKVTQEDIHRYLRERILLLELPPGARLREERVAEHFGVSRTPVRQALHRLEFEGLVELTAGAGARVSHLDPKALRDTWALRLRIAEMVGDFIRLPASPAVVEAVTSIRAELESIRASRDIAALGALYNRFHEAMLELLTNEAVIRIHDLLYVQTARMWMQLLPELDLDREIDVMTEELDETLLAIEGRSGSELARVRAEHMRRLLNRYERVMSVTAVSI